MRLRELLQFLPQVLPVALTDVPSLLPVMKVLMRVAGLRIVNGGGLG